MEGGSRKSDVGNTMIRRQLLDRNSIMALGQVQSAKGAKIINSVCSTEAKRL